MFGFLKTVNGYDNFLGGLRGHWGRWGYWGRSCLKSGIDGSVGDKI
jgi:hypothetical protein